MCGITGIVGSAANPEVIQSMTKALSHRGPDNQSHFFQPEIALGHTRLSIIDLSDSANQPLHDDEQKNMDNF